MTVAVVFLAGAPLLVGALRCWRPQPGWKVGAAYVLLVSALFAPVIFGGRLQTPTDIAAVSSPWRDAAIAQGNRPPHNPLLGDAVLQMYPFRALVRARFLRGELPLWAHELGTGQPLLGNGQSAPFAPFNLLALPLPAIEEQSVIGPWKILTALLLMHALLAGLGVGRVAAGFGAVVFALSPFNVAWLNHPHTSVSIWLPGVVLGIVGLARAESPPARRRAFAGTVVCGLAAALGGHPETLAHIALAATAAFILLAWSAAAARRRLLIDAAFAGAVIALLASPVLLPLVDAIQESQRAAAVARNPLATQPPPFTAARLETLVQPDAFGNPVSRSWRGPGNFNEISTAYAGLLTLALALVAATLGRRCALCLLLTALALAVAFHVRPFWDLWFAVPGIGHAANGRLRLLWVFGVAILGALAVDRVAIDRKARRAASVALVAVLVLAAAVPPVSTDALPRAAWIAALCSVAAALVALGVPRWRSSFGLVCLLGVLVELSVPAARFQPAVRGEVDLRPPPEVRALAPSPGGEPFRTLAMQRTLSPNLGALDGLWDPRGNDPMRPAGATRVLAARLGGRSDAPPQTVQPRRLADQAFLDVLGVRYLLAPQRAHLGEPWVQGFRWGSVRVWENPHAGKLFFVAPTVRTVPTDGDLAAAGAYEDLQRVTFRGGTTLDETAQDGHVETIAWSANTFTVRLTAATPVLVASSVSFDRGWRASLGGQPARTVEVNGGFLGFQVPAGEHVVELRYRPRGWVCGCWLALGGALVAALRLGAMRRQSAPA